MAETECFDCIVGLVGLSLLRDRWLGHHNANLMVWLGDGCLIGNRFKRRKGLAQQSTISNPKKPRADKLSSELRRISSYDECL